MRGVYLMKIHFLNVGHGDTTLVDFDGVYMLIDCNISSTNDAAYKYIDKTIPKPQDKNAKKKLVISSLPIQTKTITDWTLLTKTLTLEKYGKWFRRSDDRKNVLNITSLVGR